jgi:sulfonate transport system permease protein
MSVHDLTASANVPTPGAAKAVSRLVRQPRTADRDPVRHGRRRRIIEVTLGVAFPVALLALWQAASVNGWISRFDFPAPSDVVRELRDNRSAWWKDVRISLGRLLWGYAWGVLAGIVFGVVMGTSWVIRAMLEPTLNALYTVPKLALITVFLIVFGFTDRPVIVVIAVTVFFFVWIQTQSAIMSVGASYVEAARSFHAGRWQLFRHVLLPASLPQVFVGLRIAGGVAVLTLIGAEFVFTPDSMGIGYRINYARTILDPKQAYAGLVVAGVLGLLFTVVIRAAGRIVTPWVRNDRSVV